MKNRPKMPVRIRAGMPTGSRIPGTGRKERRLPGTRTITRSKLLLEHRQPDPAFCRRRSGVKRAGTPAGSYEEGEKSMGKYFGTDGVRGVANDGLTPELAFKI